MRNSLRMIQYMLCALLIFAFSGCGASKTTTTGIAKEPGKITFNLVLPKSTGKTVGLKADVRNFRITVTGATIPTATKEFTTPDGSLTSGSLEVYPGSNLIVSVQTSGINADASYEGFATNVTVAPAGTTPVTITLKAPLAKAQDTGCIACHASTRDVTGQNLVADFKQSGHYENQAWATNAKFGITGTGCAGCHGPSHNDTNPSASGRCNECHDPLNMFPSHKGSSVAIQTTNCNTCHNSHNTTQFVKGNCIACHSVVQNAGAGFVQDNNGVRSITQEFTKWSHHVTGVALNDAHCAACHLEGTIKNGEVYLDNTKHMIDAKTHLRDTSANTDADFAWDPSAPNHSGMDTYCMSCHDANGATSTMSVLIQKFINDNGLAAAGKTASASNPFGDTISNRYDKMQRPAVVNVDSQFNTTNNSHHAVKGPRYTGRTRTAGPRSVDTVAFAANSSATLKGKRSTIYDAQYVNADGSSTSVLNQLYVPLENATPEVAPRTGSDTLGDDSTLHCGDCHTVGQWKVGSSVDRLGKPTTAAIGAHGSQNEYLLRNSKGTDERHTQNAYVINADKTVTFQNPNGAFLVCYNCHLYSQYGSVFNATGANVAPNGPHAGEYDQAGRCDGVGNTLPFNGYTTGTATDGTQFASRFNGPISKYSKAAPYAGEQDPDFGNIFGIQCNNCHNSGLGNAYGGIHGSANNTDTTPSKIVAGVTGGAYVDGMGNTTKIERFLPGLGNAMHVPGTLGGFTGGAVVPVNTATGPAYTYTTGGVSLDANWEQKHWQQTAGTNFTATGAATGTLTSAGAGCYTLGTGAAATALEGPSVTGAGGPATEGFDTWGGCDDHNAAQGKGDHGFLKRIVRPVTY